VEEEKQDSLPSEASEAAKLGEILTGIGDGEMEGEQVLAAVLEATQGPLPPPSMLQAYKDIDESLFREIVDGARARRELDVQSLKADRAHSRSMQKRSQYLQYGLAGLSLVIAATLGFIPPNFGVNPPTVIAVAVAVVGVGGVPAATAIARRFSSRSD